MERLLTIIREFQTKFDTHVGGSVGLFLHGINLQRDLNKSDLDLTAIKETLFVSDNLTESSMTEDFDFRFRYYDDSGYVKVDINIKPESKFVVINHNGFDYKVSLMEDIIYFKKQYADKKIQKHIDDLITIETGVRPEEKKVSAYNEGDDLPF